MAFNYQAIINSVNNFAAKYGLTVYAYTPNFKGIVDAIDNLQNIQFTVEDGTIVNADVNINAAIDGTKISPNFGNQTLLTTGNVGIGTTSPTSYNSAADNLVIGSTGDNGITIATGTSNQGSLFFADGTSGTAVAEGYLIYVHGANEYMALGTSNTERMRIDSSGRLLAGTVTTGGASTYYDDLVISNTTSGTGCGITLLANAANGFNAIDFGDTDAAGRGRITYSHADDSLRIDTAGTERMRIDSQGRLNLGAINAGSNDGIFNCDINGTKFHLGFGSAFTNYYTAGSNGNHIFRCGTSEKVRINSSGNVGIGTTSPAVKFEVDCGADNAAAEFVSTDARVNIGFADNSTTLYSGLSGVRIGADGDNLALYTANSESARIDSSGRLLVGRIMRVPILQEELKPPNCRSREVISATLAFQS